MTAAPRLFVSTSEHARFEEFCSACRRDHYIGLCFGSPGIGKTVSARRVAFADQFEALQPPFSDHPEVLAPLHGLAALLNTPDVINGPRAVTDHILRLWNRLLFIEAAGFLGRSKAQRHLFDRGQFGLVLIGMPGIEKRLARYPQLYSRIGFVHHYRPLPTTELRQLLLRHLPQLVELPPIQRLDAPATSSRRSFASPAETCAWSSGCSRRSLVCSRSTTPRPCRSTSSRRPARCS